MKIKTEKDVTDAVLKVMAQTPDPRLREVMTSLVTHLHAFVREVRLSEEEFRDATAILNEIGQMSTDTHNETVLMSGSLGVSALICLLNNGDGGTTETSQNLLGPFWRLNSPDVENGGTILRSDTPGDPMFITLTFIDVDDAPVVGAEIDIWHSNTDGLYENQDEEQADFNLRGKFISDDNGQISFSSVRPAGYPIPMNTMVGRLLNAQKRHPFRPAHIHALAFKQGFKTLITQIYADDDPRLETDAQFGVTEALTGRFTKHTTAHPDQPELTEWYSLDHTLRMEAGEAKLPRPPIK